jgi:hypothetical protein
VLIGLAADSADAAVRIVSRVHRRCYFGSEEAVLTFDVKNDKAAESVGWVVTVAGKVVARREFRAEPTGAKSKAVSLRVKLPQPRPGIVVSVTVTLLAPRGQPTTVPMFVFPADPVVEKRAAIRSLDLAVYDPKGKTVARLEQLEVAYRRIRTLPQLRAETGAVLIGEDVALGGRGGIGDTLVDLTRKGCDVICLAPASGIVPLPNPKPFATGKLTFDGIEAIRRVDKRFGVHFSGNNARSAASPFQISTIGRRPVLQFDRKYDGWVWFEYETEPRRGRLRVCSVALEKAWDKSPVPRYLLVGLLMDLVRFREAAE